MPVILATWETRIEGIDSRAVQENRSRDLVSKIASAK
jgi:hypothetical protein